MPARYLTIDLYKFIDIEIRRKDKAGYYIDSMQGVSEWVWEWCMDDWYYQVDVEVDEEEIETAYSMLSKDLPVSPTWLHENYADEIREEIERAKREALLSNYEHEWIQRFYSQLVDNIRDTLRDGEIEVDTIYTYNLKQGLKSKLPLLDEIQPYQWEHDTVAIPITRQAMKDILGYKSDYEPVGWGGSDEWQRWEWLADELIDSLDIKAVNTEYIDYYGSIWGGYDGWEEYFSDYSEVWGEIRDSLKSRLSQLKAYIKNSVPISYRFI